MFIMRLLATASVADDRITFTSGTSPQNNLGATRGPIRSDFAKSVRIQPEDLGMNSFLS
jgi:hypothetical protein